MKIVIFPSEAIRIHSNLYQGCHGVLRCLLGDRNASLQRSLDFLQEAAAGLTILLEDVEKASFEIFPEVHSQTSSQWKLDLVPARSLLGFELAEGCYFRVGIDQFGRFGRKYSLYTANEDGLLPRASWLEGALECLLPKIVNPLADANRVYRVDQINGTELFYLTQI